MAMTAQTSRAGGGATERFAALMPGVPLVESPFFEQFADDAFPEAEINAVARKLNRDGYAVIDFPEPDFDAIADALKGELRGEYDFAQWRDHGWIHNDGLRLQDAWRFNAHVRKLACNTKVLDLLTRLYGRRAFPFQTLNFPVGTQQHYHSDSVHFSTVPERFMCGVWIALEDIAPDAGPLIYYPGSHKWPVVYNDAIGYKIFGQSELPTQALYHDYWSAMVAAHGLKEETFLPRKGQALIWSANLLHGGSRQTSSDATRWSQVTHYYFEDCVYLTPMLSDTLAGNIYLREMTDISTGKPVPNRYCGTALEEIAPGLKPWRDTRSAAPDIRGQAKRTLGRFGLLGAAKAARRVAGRVKRVVIKKSPAAEKPQ